MLEFNHRHYVPLLKCKPAEKDALRQLPPDVLRFLTPLLEIPEIGKPEEGEEPKSVEAQICSALDPKFCQYAANSRPFFLDPCELLSHDQAAGAKVFRHAATMHLPFVPVTRLESNDTCTTTAALAHFTHERGMAVRVPRSTLDWPGSLTDLLTCHSLRPCDIHLIIDLGDIADMIEPGIVSMSRLFLRSVPNMRTWRTLTLVASSFPKSMGKVPSQGHSWVDRADWTSWLSIARDRTSTDRRPSFGDAGIQHIGGVENVDRKKFDASPTIRYATDEQWLFVKGASRKVLRPTDQFPILAGRLCQEAPLNQYFRGPTHCKGCSDIVDSSKFAKGLASPQVWRRIGTVHHITTVVGALFRLASSEETER